VARSLTGFARDVVDVGIGARLELGNVADEVVVTVVPIGLHFGKDALEARAVEAREAVLHQRYTERLLDRVAAATLVPMAERAHENRIGGDIEAGLQDERKVRGRACAFGKKTGEEHDRETKKNAPHVNVPKAPSP
jgi:hypothetical protein